MKKFLVVVHLFYTDQWKQISNYLKNIDIQKYDYDLFVTLPYSKSSFQDSILSVFHNANIIFSENVGYDIWPFFKVINQTNLDNYEFVIKLHSKRSMGSNIAVINKLYVLKGNDWRNLLFSFISSKKHFEKTIDAFNNEKKLGMVNSHKLFDVSNSYESIPHRLYCFNSAKNELNKMGVSAVPFDEVLYVAGTMFICRASILKPFLKMNYSVDDFVKADRNNENDLAHIIERVFGWLVSSQNYYIGDPYSDKKLSFKDYYRYKMFYLDRNSFLGRTLRYFRKIRRFIFRIDVIEGIKIIKIFKIPVHRCK